MPIYTMAVAAELTKTTPRMLREYEKAGFIKPGRLNGQRRFSDSDIQFIKNIRLAARQEDLLKRGQWQTVHCW